MRSTLPARAPALHDAEQPGGSRGVESRADWRTKVRQTAADFLFLISGLALATTSFTVLVTGVAVSASLAVVWVGIPLMGVTLKAAHGFALVEQARLHRVAPTLSAVAGPRGAAGPGSAPGGPRHPQAWRELSHGVLALPLAVATSSAAVLWVVGAVAGTTGWVWTRWLPVDSVGLGSISDLPPGQAWSSALAGLLLAVTAPPVLRWCVRLHAGLATALLHRPTAS